MFQITKGTIDELHPFILSHYTKTQYILNYTKSHLEWDLASEVSEVSETNGVSEILLLKNGEEIIGSITGKFQDCIINNTTKKIVIVNFLCIREDFRFSNLHKYLIKSLENISHSRGAELGIYISSDLHSSYTCKVGYYFIKNFPEKSLDLDITENELVNRDIIEGLTRYYSKSNIHPIFSKNFFNDGVERGIIKTFTLRTNGRIVGFISYYLLDCLDTKTEVTIKQAYTLYYFAEDLSIFKETFKSLEVNIILVNDILDFSDPSTRELLGANSKSINEIYYYIRDTSVSGSMIIPNKLIGMFIP